jgi:hypothetical protein
LAEHQPGIWTSIDFEVADGDVQSAEVAFVVFRGRVFRYPRGDAAGRASAQAHGRALDVPEPQLDWTV